MRLKTIILCGCAALATSGAISAPALAQDGAGDRAQSTDTTNPADIIVTARRRTETAQETPVALTVLNAELLDRYGVKGVATIAQLTPGLFTGETSGAVGGSISLRGIGSGEGQPFIDQAVSVNVDGVPVSTAQILRAAQMDLQQIEVLRGPQALFFGKNSPGGIISITTANPGERMEAMVRGGYEFKADEWYVDATVSTPLGETAGARLAGHYSKMKGYITVISPPTPGIVPSSLKAFPKQEEIFLRGTLSFEPSDRFSARIKATFTDTSIVGGPSYYSDIVHCPYGTPQEAIVVASNCQNDGVIVTSQIPSGLMALDSFMINPNGYRKNRQWLLTGSMDYKLTDELTLSSVTGYYDVDEKLNSNGGYGLVASNVFDVQYYNKQFSEELRLASSFKGPLNFLLGGFYETRKLYTRTWIGFPLAVGFGQLPIESTHQKQDSYSVFGQVLFDIGDKIQLTAGGRYTHELKNLQDYSVSLINADGTHAPPVDVTQLPAYPGSPDPKLKFNNFSPEVTLTYKPVQDVMLFASYKQGFKSGGFDAGLTSGGILANPARDQTFEPEKVEGFEVGLKSSFWDRQMTFNLTGFWYDYDNLQVTTYDTAARTFTTQNAAKARVRGIEGELRFHPRSVPGLNLHASAAYNDAKFREYLADCWRGQTVALGCNVNFVPSAPALQVPPGPANAVVIDGVYGFYNLQNLAGVRLRKAPEFTASVGGYYEFPVTGALMVSLSSDLAYSSGYNYGTTYQPFTYQKAHAKLDATLRLFTEDKRWELAVIGRNLTNKRNLINGIDRTGTGGVKGSAGPTCATLAQTGCQRLPDVIGTPALPRTVAVQLTWKY